jgi:hypothetical protein
MAGQFATDLSPTNVNGRTHSQSVGEEVWRD